MSCLRRREPDHRPPLQLPQHPHPPYPSGPLAGPGVHGNLPLQRPFTLNLLPSSYPPPTRASPAPLSLPDHPLGKQQQAVPGTETGWRVFALFALLLAVSFLQGMRVLVEVLTLEALSRESVKQSVAASLYRAVGWALLPGCDRSLGNVVLLVVTRPSLVAGFTSSVLFAHWSMKASLVTVLVCSAAMRFTTLRCLFRNWVLCNYLS
ncbi:hypothetical protein FHG87_011914 [Trinorchestia longiramus]|nr:hypothetical protein FHG87_011914 [Trinorchestia longiramus]